MPTPRCAGFEGSYPPPVPLTWINERGGDRRKTAPDVSSA